MHGTPWWADGTEAVQARLMVAKVTKLRVCVHSNANAHALTRKCTHTQMLMRSHANAQNAGVGGGGLHLEF